VPQKPVVKFVLHVIAFALGIATFVISVLLVASFATIGALLSVAVFCLGFAGITSASAAHQLTSDVGSTLT
jgi:hypothetical protein